MLSDFLFQLIDLFPNSVLQALVLSIVAMGVMIPFRFLNFPDLTSEGAYPMGGAIGGALLVAGLDPFSSLFASAFLGGCLGLGTAYLHLKFKVNSLLAGIILSTMVYSLNLRFMGKPNLHLFEHKTIFSSIENALYSKIILLAFIHLILVGFLYVFLKSHKGLRFRAIGLNPILAEKLGASLPIYIMGGLFLSNALNAFGGSLMAQIQQYADIGMGIGIVIHALAALMIGETILGLTPNIQNDLKKQLLAPFIGAFIYEQIRSIVIVLGLSPSDHKFVTGFIVILAIFIRQLPQPNRI